MVVTEEKLLEPVAGTPEKQVSNDVKEDGFSHTLRVPPLLTAHRESGSSCVDAPIRDTATTAARRIFIMIILFCDDDLKMMMMMMMMMMMNNGIL